MLRQANPTQHAASFKERFALSREHRGQGRDLTLGLKRFGILFFRLLPLLDIMNAVPIRPELRKYCGPEWRRYRETLLALPVTAVLNAVRDTSISIRRTSIMILATAS